MLLKNFHVFNFHGLRAPMKIFSLENFPNYGILFSCMKKGDLWPDLTKAGFDTHNKHVHFSPPLDSFIHQLTIDGYFTVHSSSVCFSHGLFLWPVWRPRAHGCSLNGPGAVANWLKTSSKVDIDVRNWFGNILWDLQLNMTLGMVYWPFMWQIKILQSCIPPSSPT